MKICTFEMNIPHKCGITPNNLCCADCKKYYKGCSCISSDYMKKGKKNPVTRKKELYICSHVKEI
jgi:hypothetical protein